MHLNVRQGIFNVLTSIAMAAFVAMLFRAPLSLSRNYVYVLGDLRAFYCSARVARAGFDPYLAEPLGACERASVDMLSGNFVIPAPLPGYAIGFLEPLAGLTFPVAAVIWSTLLALTFFFLSIVLTRLTAWPYGASLIALLPLAFMIPINQGQLVPIGVALLVAATLALSKNRDGFAALLAAGATVEPHIGLPACIALFIERPRARIFLVSAALAIAAVSVHTNGFAGMLEYAGRVLPQHIASEARYDDQYSLTYLLTWIGVPVAPAIALGQWSYWLLAAAGIGAAIALRRTTGDSRYLLFVPMATSVIGGPYVHQEHLLAAVPLALLLAATARPQTRAFATLGLALVAWPAKFVLEKFDVPGVVMQLSTRRLPQPTATVRILADTAWATRIAEHVGHLPLFLAKVPSWIGLAILVALLVARVRRAQPVRSAARQPQAPERATQGAVPATYRMQCAGVAIGSLLGIRRLSQAFWTRGAAERRRPTDNQTR